MTHPTTEAKEPLAYSINELAAASTISRSEIYKDIEDGKLATKRRGRRQIILAAEAKRWLEAHEDA